MNNLLKNKSFLSKLIEVYRILDNESVANIITDKKSTVPICSNPTYQLVRNEKSVRDIQIYYDMLKNQGRQLYQKEMILDYTILNHAAEYYLYEECTKEAEIFLEQLKPAKTVHIMILCTK